jgi:hypothetical protein
VAAFGALCFGCGYLTAFIVTRNHWRDEMFLVFAFHSFHRNPKGNHKIEIRLFPDPRTTA